MTQSPPPADMTLQRSSRDATDMATRLTAWLTTQLPDGAAPEVVVHDGVQTNGMSSETVLIGLTATDPDDGARTTREYVARVAPAAEDLPVFAEYRLGDQYEAMRLAGELADVPVPPLGLAEPTGEVLGTPFFLMHRLDGAVPPDVLPYPFGDNWLFDALPAQQQALQRSSIEVLTRLHGIADAPTRFAFLDPAITGHDGATPLARNLAKTRAWYEYAVAQGSARSPLVERGLAWLAANLPDDEGEPVLVWGDARIGNMMYRDFAPVAVLDWEMATLGPRELDVAWMVFAHEVFQGIATMLGLPGMPDFLRAEDVVATYEELAGTTLGDLAWYRLHAAVNWGCVFLRTSARQIHFGEIEAPDDPEAVFHHRPLFEQVLAEVGA